MNRLAGRVYAPPSKATPSTLCQKCLKRGHYNYECTSKAEERPYVSRPSRTQQLLNPKLQPKLTSDEPNPLLRQDGIANEQLNKINEERGRKRRRRPEDGDASDRSASSSSVASISTISTNVSRSPSPQKSKQELGKKSTSKRLSDNVSGSRSRRTHKRRHSDSSSEYSSDVSEGLQRQRHVEKNKARASPSRRPTSENSPPLKHFDRRSRSPRIHARQRKRSVSPVESYPKSGRDRSGPDRQRQQPPRQRSLSPYSKRIALTQAMNIGR